MKVLIIEDNPIKRDKIVDYLKSNFDFNIVDASSFNSGFKAAIENSVDFVILDMSIPTFDRTESSHGGRFRKAGGFELMDKLRSRGVNINFLVLTGYQEFGDSGLKKDINAINSDLQKFGNFYKGIISFDSSDSSWEEKLGNLIHQEIL